MGTRTGRIEEVRTPFDQLDIRIMDLLQSDGRMPFVKIAEQLGVSDTTVRTRVQRLTGRFGLKFVVDVDPNSLGLVYLNMALRVQGPSLGKVVQRLANQQQVVFLARTTGGYDLMAEVICRDYDDLMSMLDDVRAVPGITHIDTFTVLRVEKEDFRFSRFAQAPSS
jgi:Lrp/AsnC family transcriptional regulator for asnA, asnC and gidA